MDWLLYGSLLTSVLTNLILAWAYISKRESVLAATREGWRAGREMYRDSWEQLQKDFANDVTKPKDN
jgi:hypothetical protein